MFYFFVVVVVVLLFALFVYNFFSAKGEFCISSLENLCIIGRRGIFGLFLCLLDYIFCFRLFLRKQKLSL